MAKRGYNAEHDQPVIFIGGRRGSGKTTLALQLMKDWKRAIIFDPKKQYPGEVYTSLIKLYDRLKRDPGPVVAVFRPDLTFGDDDAEADERDKQLFNLFCQIVYQDGEKNGPVLFLCDEMDRFTGPGPKVPRWFGILVNEGRHAKVAMIGISRRPAKIPKDFIENAHRMYLFHTKGGALNYLKSTLGDDVYILPTLKPFQYLLWSESEADSIIHTVSR